VSMTDPIADLFTRIRNACMAGRNKLDVPFSRLKEAVSRVLEREGYLREVRATDVEGMRRLRLYVKVDEDGHPVLRHLERMSKPGRRLYHDARTLPRVLRGLGTGIYSTPKGVLTDRECREQRVGGEYLGRVW